MASKCLRLVLNSIAFTEVDVFFNDRFLIIFIWDRDSNHPTSLFTYFEMSIIIILNFFNPTKNATSQYFLSYPNKNFE